MTDLEFQLKLNNKNKVKERDLFVNFIYNLLPEKYPDIDYSVSDDFQTSDSSIFFLKFKKIIDVFRVGFMFGSFIENEINKKRKIRKEGKNESGRIDPFIEYLRFLGYSIKSKAGIFLITHPEKSSFLLGEYSAGLIFQCNFRTTKYSKASRNEYLEFINYLNVNSDVAKFYDSEDCMSCIFWFPNLFDKKYFGHFIDLWEEDISVSITKNDIYDKFLLTE
ncbi:MAG: hypothetical protein HF312_00280 [Ignavibacteria bacterium]|jgi:hypothetical protein|nr:hypothetical protein [Ignavibacteria bacterium]MCU7518618.1 hypothetical protein [Ignavibacteria bacterium]